MMNHEELMRAAIKMAQKAANKDEVPIGAVIIKDGRIIAKGYNTRETRHDPLGHAEIMAIKKAARRIGGWRLSGCTLYVTLEPCPMCAGAIINARIDKVVFGAYDPKAGAFGSLYDLSEGRLNHKPQIIGGVCLDQCAALLKNFFAEKRK
jgi:tRNA(adenine34) deaminase